MDRSHRGPAKDAPQFSDMIDETGHILGAVLVAACEHSGKRVDVDGTNAIPARELFLDDLGQRENFALLQQVEGEGDDAEIRRLCPVELTPSSDTVLNALPPCLTTAWPTSLACDSRDIGN